MSNGFSAVSWQRYAKWHHAQVLLPRRVEVDNVLLHSGPSLKAKGAGWAKKYASVTEVAQNIKDDSESWSHQLRRAFSRKATIGLLNVVITI